MAEAAKSGSTKEPVPIDQEESARPKAPVSARSVLLECLAGDAEVRAAMRDLIIGVLKDVQIPGTVLVAESDAEQNANVLDLIDTRLRQQIRADAFRKPASATNARLF